MTWRFFAIGSTMRGSQLSSVAARWTKNTTGMPPFGPELAVGVGDAARGDGPGRGLRVRGDDGFVVTVLMMCVLRATVGGVAGHGSAQRSMTTALPRMPPLASAASACGVSSKGRPRPTTGRRTPASTRAAIWRSCSPLGAHEEELVGDAELLGLLADLAAERRDRQAQHGVQPRLRARRPGREDRRCRSPSRRAGGRAATSRGSRRRGCRAPGRSRVSSCLEVLRAVVDDDVGAELPHEVGVRRRWPWSRPSRRGAWRAGSRSSRRRRRRRGSAPSGPGGTLPLLDERLPGGERDERQRRRPPRR